MTKHTKIINPIFIVGSSRSGTCLLGEILKKHPLIHSLIEYPKIFSYANYLATEPQYKIDCSAEIEKKIADLYHKVWLRNYNKCRTCSSACQKLQKLTYRGWFPCYDPLQIQRYADKSHTHLMNIDILLKVFPEAQFLHIYRDARGVVSSMLKYPRLVRRFTSKTKITSMSSWPQNWYGVRDLEEYHLWEKYSLEKKMTIAWKSRIQIGQKYSSQLDKNQWLDVSYEDLVTEPEKYLHKIFDFLNVFADINIASNISASSVEKWKKELTSSQIQEIESNML